MGTDDEAGVVAQLVALAREQAKQIELLLGARAAPPAIVSRITWPKLWDAYAVVERDKLDSWDTVESRAKHVLRILEDESVAESTLHTILRYRAARKKELTIRKGPTTATTRNREVELILRMARWGSRQRPPLCPDPFVGIPRADLFEAVENIRRNVVEDASAAGDPLTLADLLEGASPVERAIVLTAHSSGMRRGELSVLERSWIDRRPDLTGQPLRIIEIPPGVSKGRRGRRKGRQAFLSVEALQAIDEYHATLPFPLRYRSLWVFVNPKTGERYSAQWFTLKFKEIARRRGAVGPSGPAWLHDLRRSFITLARRRGEDTQNIMAASGHKTLSAFQRYDIHARRDAIVVRDRIEAARARELAALAEQRRGPKSATTRPNTSAQKNNT